MSAPGERRVAYVASAFPHLTETFVLREVGALERAGWEVSVFALKQSASPGRHAEAQRWLDRTQRPALLSRATLGASLYYLRRAPLRFFLLWARALWWHRASANFLVRTPVALLKGAALAREMERRGIRHVHAHFATHPALAALTAATLVGGSFSVTVHAHDIFVRRAGLGQKLRRASFVACISEFNRRLLLRSYPDLAPGKLALVRCGVDPVRFCRAARRAGSDRPVLICVASLQEYKGPQVLVEACAQLRRRLPSFRCLLVGEGPLRGELEARIRALDLASQVRLVGARSEEEVAELLRSADVFVAPSVVARDGQMDGIPVALMEAMAAELPVVASELSGIPELVEHERTGLLVPPGDPGALASAIERLVRDPELSARLAAEGRARVEREFTLDANVARLAALLEAALTETAPGSVPRVGEPQPAPSGLGEAR